MRAAIHPRLTTTTVVCGSCGTTFETRSTVDELRLEVCSSCHPAYVGGRERPVEGSRVERFERRWGPQRRASARG